MLQSYLLVQGHSEHDGHATTVPDLEWECARVYVTLFQADSTEEALETLMLLWSLGCEVSEHFTCVCRLDPGSLCEAHCCVSCSVVPLFKLECVPARWPSSLSLTVRLW